MNSFGLEKLRRSRRRFGSIVLASSIQPSTVLHEEHREVLADLRSSMDWLEDTDDFERAHEALDQAGKFAREVYPEGCVFQQHDGSYWVECPVALAHNRIGLSTGFIIYAAECSICGADPEDCPHITGRLYDGEPCVRIITDGRVTDVSYVARPNQPDCRITSLSIPHSVLQEKLGDEFKPGVQVTCDRCLSDCDGVSRAFEEEYSTKGTA